MRYLFFLLIPLFSFSACVLPPNSSVISETVGSEYTTLVNCDSSAASNFGYCSSPFFDSQDDLFRYEHVIDTYSTGCNDPYLTAQQKTIYYKTCIAPDQSFSYDDTQFKIASTVNPYDCNVDADTLNTLTSQCSSLGGSYQTLTVTSCCSVNYCLIPIDTVEPDVNCTVPNSHYDYSGESCVCDDGYISDYSFTGLISCSAPECPPTYTDYSGFPQPLFMVTDDVSKCNFFSYSDGYSIDIDPPGIVCCYGQEAIDDNSTCGTNEIEVNGDCYPISHSDDNQTDPHECPIGEYWSFTANGGDGGCLPFFPDENITTNSDSSLPSGTTLANVDNTTGDVTSTLSAPSQKNFEDAMSPFLDKAKDVLKSYVLLDLPIQTGTCSNDFSVSFTIFGTTYKMDLNKYFSSINQNLSWISSLVIFMFAFAGVVIVLSSGKD